MLLDILRSKLVVVIESQTRAPYKGDVFVIAVISVNNPVGNLFSFIVLCV